MADRPVQNFENHVRIDKKIFAAAGLYFLALVLGIAGIYFSATLVAVGLALCGLAGILMGLITRAYAVTVQDRVVRLEMRLRLAEVLPSDLKARIPEFQMSQLVGLRFASDEELPDLARKVLDENITSSTEIKKLVKNWVPDFQRV